MRVKQFGKKHVAHWTEGVPIEYSVWEQVENLISLKFVNGVSIMPDSHWGNGCSIGTVASMTGAVIPAVAGVDLSCGITTFKTGIKIDKIRDCLESIKENIEKTIPHGANLEKGQVDHGSWQGGIPPHIQKHWNLSLKEGFEYLSSKYQKIKNHPNNLNQLGTLGGGNHFIELSVDEEDNVYVMVHSGSRGIGNKMARVFMDIAKKECKRWFIKT